MSTDRKIYFAIAAVLVVAAIGAFIGGIIYYTTYAKDLPSIMGKNTVIERGLYHRTSRGGAGIAAGVVLTLAAVGATYRGVRGPSEHAEETDEEYDEA